MNINNYQQFSNYHATITLFTDQQSVQILPFEGLISNLRFKQCQNIEYHFGKDSNMRRYNYLIDCNARCKICTGPTQYDCASCYDEQIDICKLIFINVSVNLTTRKQVVQYAKKPFQTLFPSKKSFIKSSISLKQKTIKSTVMATLKYGRT
ncbi:unnamed protein product (macronuclear) [Paramecium tetraurelia]|uniref:Uncharacterized protein n=1 Tax=Paramecium tetraurelia TaxID=5888 RepID=A0CFJ0_PARTE|nr:uncharacterized protein GSPATT00037996001 [Paramecium tetraurelia]CAK69557.1 unnamed protein product [Paramecium tetraurelia]|eukprot:XP_001436954.1 hypothetical protein (macronuclear) [Paramecium tetraurelia strain d4-2]